MDRDLLMNGKGSSKRAKEKLSLKASRISPAKGHDDSNLKEVHTSSSKRKVHARKRKTTEDEIDSVDDTTPEKKKDTSVKKAKVSSPVPKTEGSQTQDITVGHEITRLSQALAYLETPTRQLDEDTIHAVIGNVFCPQKTRGGLVYIASLNLQNVLKNDYNGRYSKESESQERVRIDLGLSGQDLSKTDMVIAVIHGPYTEEETQNVYNVLDENVNNHWSILCWIEKNNRAYHYDSLASCNSSRCAEVVRVLRKYAIISPLLENFHEAEFMPIQMEGWECAYYVLLLFHILMDNRENNAETFAVTKHQMETQYRSLIDTIRNRNGPFRKFLSAQLTKVIDSSIYDICIE